MNDLIKLESRREGKWWSWMWGWGFDVVMEVVEEEEKKRMREKWRERGKWEGDGRITEGKGEASHVNDKITSLWERRTEEEEERERGRRGWEKRKTPELGWSWLALAGLGLFLFRAWLLLAYTTPNQAIDLPSLKDSNTVLLQRQFTRKIDMLHLNTTTILLCKNKPSNSKTMKNINKHILFTNTIALWFVILLDASTYLFLAEGSRSPPSTSSDSHISGISDLYVAVNLLHIDWLTAEICCVSTEMWITCLVGTVWVIFDLADWVAIHTASGCSHPPYVLHVFCRSK